MVTTTIENDIPNSKAWKSTPGLREKPSAFRPVLLFFQPYCLVRHFLVLYVFSATLTIVANSVCLSTTTQILPPTQRSIGATVSCRRVMGVEHILPASVRSAPSVVNFDDRHFSTQLKFIKTGSSKAEHAHNNLYRYSKIYVNIEYSTIKYSRI